jgi:tetratricopeptide (TPR) repeat protein
MDLSQLKWPLIAAVVVLGAWLISDPGVDYMYSRFTREAPGADPERDKVNEAGLSRLGGFLLKTFRYQRAQEVFQRSLQLFPEGENALYNQYRLAKCAEKLNNPQEAIRLLRELRAMDAHSMDERVPHGDNLKLRADKLMELHDLGELRGY